MKCLILQKWWVCEASFPKKHGTLYITGIPESLIPFLCTPEVEQFAPEKWWLEDEPFLSGTVYFQGWTVKLPGCTIFWNCLFVVFLKRCGPLLTVQKTSGVSGSLEISTWTFEMNLDSLFPVESRLLPGKVTCPLKINGWKMYFLCLGTFVRFRGCIMFMR